MWAVTKCTSIWENFLKTSVDIVFGIGRDAIRDVMFLGILKNWSDRKSAGCALKEREYHMQWAKGLSHIAFHSINIYWASTMWQHLTECWEYDNKKAKAKPSRTYILEKRDKQIYTWCVADMMSGNDNVWGKSSESEEGREEGGELGKSS